MLFLKGNATLIFFVANSRFLLHETAAFCCMNSRFLLHLKVIHRLETMMNKDSQAF